jgi:hypothetical protein
MDAFLAMLMKPFLLLILVAIMAAGVVSARALPESWLRRLLLRKIW